MRTQALSMTARRLVLGLSLALNCLPLAAQTRSVSELYQRAPMPPSTVREAQRWVGTEAKIVDPKVAAYRSELESVSRAAMTSTAQAAYEIYGNPMAIDAARLQSDPDYRQAIAAQAQAQTVQNQSLPQAQLIAVTAAQAARSQYALTEDAIKLAQETPAVTQALTAMQLAQAAWQADPSSSVQAQLYASGSILAHSYTARRDAIQQQYPLHDGHCIGCPRKEKSQIERQTQAYWRAMLALENQWLSEARSVFAQARAARAPAMAQADQLLASVGYGDAVKSQIGRQVVSGYQTHLLIETLGLLEYSQVAALHATGIAAAAKIGAQLSP